MANEIKNLVTLEDLKQLAVRTKSDIEKAIADLDKNTFLDQAQTKFVQSFKFSTTTYKGATNPNLDGKPVLVLAVIGDDDETAYSFLNMETLVSTYTTKEGDSSKILKIDGYEIEVKIDPSADNLLTVTSSGLKVTGTNITGKADIVAGATSGHLAGLNANGNLIDSGVAAVNVMTKPNSSIAGNLSKFTVGGAIEDSGISVASILTSASVASDTAVTDMLNEVFGA